MTGDPIRVFEITRWSDVTWSWIVLFDMLPEGVAWKEYGRVKDDCPPDRKDWVRMRVMDTIWCDIELEVA
jgi:hypothetical protein